MPQEKQLYVSRPKTLEEANAEIARLQAELLLVIRKYQEGTNSNYWDGVPLSR